MDLGFENPKPLYVSLYTDDIYLRFLQDLRKNTLTRLDKLQVSMRFGYRVFLIGRPRAAHTVPKILGGVPLNRK